MENTNTPVAAVENEETRPTATATRTRKPREKVRPLEELKKIESTKSLSDKEKTILIEHYRAEVNRLTAAANSYQHNAEAAFEKSRMLEDAYNKMIETYNAKLNDIVQATSTLYKTIFLIAKDGNER